ncbi:hypothetical protein BX285_2957 [Streptomyces sp. 1114.5]|uniref:DUF6879 family protein n=1 Tax=unclassified Streptomyces TaxID=2593676 RepID=UPI000BDD1F79|nr:MULTISPECIES: DUF6879 family protein [unclassified Streptomyces]RKT18529.1 hypothetical protein BX285_2957 [Streptomyces sp. 1114.5]SOB84730.1 hypothetical protein SAMN06272789_4990 [Streptomyces sp. 1331.2]
MSQRVPSFFELLNAADHSAVHLEMRDQYGVSEESDEFTRWHRGEPVDTDPDSEYWRDWTEAIRNSVARGVVVRRARIVSEPVSDYIRYEHHITSVNLAAGELVRWLPRSQASDIALPGNDFWLFDRKLARFNLFDGFGGGLGPQHTEASAVVQLCASAFESVWARGIDHEKYSV